MRCPYCQFSGQAKLLGANCQFLQVARVAPARGSTLRRQLKGGVQGPPCRGFRGAPEVPFLLSPPAAASKKRKRGFSGAPTHCPPDSVPRTPAKGGCPLQSRRNCVQLTPKGVLLSGNFYEYLLLRLESLFSYRKTGLPPLRSSQAVCAGGARGKLLAAGDPGLFPGSAGQRAVPQCRW